MAHDILTHTVGTCARCADLETQLAQALHDPIWGIGTRQAVERRLTQLGPDMAAIVLDIDKMHERNTELGHDGVDWRVSQIMQHVRADDTFAGRWLRGDEVVVFCNAANAEGLAIRLLIAFEMRGMSATIVITVASREGIAEGIARIDVAKQENQRGQII